jgi:predicted RNase H-like HicB family nuclease
MKRRDGTQMLGSGYIELTVKVTHEDDGYVATCEELGVSTCGDSLDNLVEELRAMVLQHLDVLTRNGVLLDFLKKNGIRLHRGIPAASPRALRLPVRPGEMVTRLTERLPMLAGT